MVARKNSLKRSMRKSRRVSTKQRYQKKGGKLSVKKGVKDTRNLLGNAVEIGGDLFLVVPKTGLRVIADIGKGGVKLADNAFSGVSDLTKGKMKLIKVPQNILGRAKKLADNTGSGLYKLMLKLKQLLQKQLLLHLQNNHLNFLVL